MAPRKTVRSELIRTLWTSFTSNNAKAKKELAIMDEIWTLQFEDRCGPKKTTQAEWERVHSQINETPAGAPTVLSVLS